MFGRLAIWLCVFVAAAVATDVKKCAGNKPFPLEVRIKDCKVPPCDVVKGEDIIFEIDFVAYKDIVNMTTLAKATTLGLTVPYELPENVRNVCSNLLFDAYCPLYPTEDVTYLFVFPIGNYPEINVKVEISIVDQDREITTCFLCDIRVKKRHPRFGTQTVYEVDF